MLELLVSVCLIDEPSRCKDVSLVVSEESVTPFQCMMNSQPEIAKWIDEHPKWVVRRWTCQRAGVVAKI